jgi:hypothetical protein
LNPTVYFRFCDQGKPWASGTIRRLPDEDAIPPRAWLTLPLDKISVVSFDNADQ